MSVKAMASIVTAVAITIVAAHDARPSGSNRNPWLRDAVQVDDELPPWHPPVEDRLPPGHPPIQPRYPGLPEGHPPIPGLDSPGCAPDGGTRPDGIERDGGFLSEAPPVIST